MVGSLYGLLAGADVGVKKGDDDIRISLWNIRARINAVRVNGHTFDVQGDYERRSSGLPFAIFYVDYMLLFSKNMDEHVIHCEEVFESINNTN